MKKSIAILLIVLLTVCAASAQTTAFTYQGSLSDGASPAAGNYDFEFALYDAASGGAQLGATLTRPTIAVANGIFAVSLDFGGQFPGANRFLEIRVRTAGGGSYTLLSPRQPVNSSPYSIKSLSSETATTATNATQLGGLSATGFIQNSTSPQSASNFNISGDGRAQRFTAVNGYYQEGPFGLRLVYSSPGNSLYAGGDTAGTGNFTVHVGHRAGAGNVSGSFNAFLGAQAGQNNTFGASNVFVGLSAGNTNTTGSNNTAIGKNADVTSNNLSYATVIGSDATASISNSIYLGRSAGQDAVRIPGATIIDGSLVVHTLGSAGSTAVCLNAADRFSPCSSSLRYKTNIQRFGFGMNLINQLKPITFDWKDGGMHDLGLGAEDVAAIEPLLVTYNSKGEIEGVKYDRIGVVLINAIKEQQAQISSQESAISSQQDQIGQQRNLIETQQRQIESMKKLICQTNKDADFCKE